jgi:hypothetical protein
MTKINFGPLDTNELNGTSDTLSSSRTIAFRRSTATGAGGQFLLQMGTFKGSWNTIIGIARTWRWKKTVWDAGAAR